MKTGRNDPCHCGSGRKYKKCCLAGDEKELHASLVPSSHAAREAVLARYLDETAETVRNASPEELFPFQPGCGPLHDLAHELRDAAVGSDQARRARSLAGYEQAIEAIVAIGEALALELPRLAAAYEALAVIMLETLIRRARLGMYGLDAPLDDLECEIERSIDRGEMPAAARGIFARLRSRALAAAGGEAHGNADLDKIRARIQGLRGKTIDKGCTEQEALAAAEKVAELLERYGLSLSETEIRTGGCEGFGVDTGRKRRGPMDECVAKLAEFCDCRAWMEYSNDESLRWIFFGLPADVAGARYLYEVLARTFETETDAFRAGELYQRHPSSQRRGATNSFQTGLSHGIRDKLDGLMATREAARAASKGRDLVPLKDGVLDEEMDRLGLSLITKRGARSRRVLSEAFDEGQQVGQRFEWHQGLETSPGAM